MAKQSSAKKAVCVDSANNSEVMSPAAREATAADATEITAALFEFILVMLGVDDKLKAGARLATVLARKLASEIDAAAVLQSKEGFVSAPAPETELSRPSTDVNLRVILDQLSIRSIEVTREALDRILDVHTILGPLGGVCAARSRYAASPYHWLKGESWMKSILRDSALATTEARGCESLTLRIPHATHHETGAVGRTLHVANGPDPVCETAVGSRRLDPERRLMIRAAYCQTLRAALRNAGVLLVGDEEPRGFEVALFDTDTRQQIFHLSMILPS